MMSPAGARHTRPPGGEAAQVESLLAQLESLAGLPPLAAELTQFTGEDSWAAVEIVRLVQSDAQLWHRVQRLADVPGNPESSEHGLRAPGAALAVRDLAVAVTILDCFPPTEQQPDSSLDRLAFWKHSAAVGCLAELIAAASPARGGGPPIDPRLAFACGLLHDLGKVALDACFPRSYARVLQVAEARQCSTADAEREVLGLDHLAAGNRLATRWGLPAAMRECIWLHHQDPSFTPSRIGHQRLVRIIQIADRLVHRTQDGQAGNQIDASLLGLSDAALTGLCAQLPDRLTERVAALGLEAAHADASHASASIAELVRLNAELRSENRRLEHRAACLDSLIGFSRRLGPHPAHEAVLKALAETAVGLAGTSQAAAFTVSPARGRALLVGGPSSEGLQAWGVQCEQALAALAAAEGRLPNVRVLPPALQDRVAACLGGPAEYVEFVRHERQVLGAVFLTNVPAEHVRQSLGLLCETAGAWLHAAESAGAAELLTDEFADLNRRLSDSRAEAARSRMLAAIAQCAAGAAHELNNPLAVISGRAQMLAAASEDEDVRRNAVLIAEHAAKASQIVGELMDFAKPPRPVPVDFAIGGLLAGLRDEWLAKGPLSREEFRLHLSDGLPLVRADAAQIRVLCDELIRNSIEALTGKAGPLLTMNCRADVADDTVVIRVEDNGCGMTAEVAEHAIDPFFSSRPAGRGRGMGLARATRYAGINSGTIRLSSRPGSGTAVDVCLPAAGQGSSRDGASLPGGNRRS